MKKLLFVSVVASVLTVLFSPGPVLAGGGYLEVIAKNRGIAGKNGVEVDVYSYGQAYGTGAKIGHANDNFSIRVEDAPSTTTCAPESALTNSDGHATFTCTSQTPGTFQIYPHLQMPATGFWVKITSKGTQIHFDSETGESSPPIAAPPKVVTNTEDSEKLQEKVETLEGELTKTQEEAQKEQEAMKNEIAALQEQSRQQQSQISALRAYIENIFARIASLFSFLNVK